MASGRRCNDRKRTGSNDNERLRVQKPDGARPSRGMNRIEILKGFLEDSPDDSFSRYALALEYVKLGQYDDAVREFETVKTGDPGYVATYFQLGQLYQKLGRQHDAEKTFRTGITV